MGREILEFTIENQYQMIHIPDKPNGFGIFIIGDVNHFVEKGKSLWTQNIQRYQFITDLLENGYTVFYSNLYGKHWGSPESVNLAVKVYEVALRYVTLNDSIHILAEGMGALVAMSLADEMPNKIRSMAFINPCIDLPKHIENEKEKKIFFKTLLSEVADAYSVDVSRAEAIVKHDYTHKDFSKINIPVKIWHQINHQHYPIQDHSRPFERVNKEEGKRVELLVQLADRFPNLGEPIINYYQDFEKLL